MASKTRTARIASPRAPPSSALAKLGGGHDGHRPRNADGGDRRLPPGHAPPRATATTMMTTTMTRGGCHRGWSWRTPPRRQWTSSWQGGRGRWWRATMTTTTTAKEAILPYQTMPLPAALWHGVPYHGLPKGHALFFTRHLFHAPPFPRARTVSNTRH